MLTIWSDDDILRALSKLLIDDDGRKRNDRKEKSSKPAKLVDNEFRFKSRNEFDNEEQKLMSEIELEKQTCRLQSLSNYKLN